MKKRPLSVAERETCADVADAMRAALGAPIDALRARAEEALARALAAARGRNMRDLARHLIHVPPALARIQAIAGVEGTLFANQYLTDIVQAMRGTTTTGVTDDATKEPHV